MVVYSLVCWGGRTGKVVSISASTDIVTLTNHGLRNGTKLWPSGTLPSELNASTPVYARSTGNNTFTLHTSAAGAIANTGQILFAGSSTYAAVTLKSDLVTSPSTALAAYGLSDLSRWGSSGSERIYDGLNSWQSARTPNATSFDPEVCEIGEAFAAFYSGAITIGMKSPSVFVTSRINGIRTPAFHGGNYAAESFVLLGSPVSGGGVVLNGNNAGVEGFIIDAVGNASPCVNLVGIGAFASKVFAKGSGRGFTLNSPGARVVNCRAKSCSVGFYVNAFNSGIVCANNIAVGNTTGFGNDGSTSRGFYYNNISVGNTTNWGASTLSADPLLAVASHNAGLSGEAWITTGGTRITIATTDFADYANDNFYPASSASPQVDSGIAYYGVADSDITDAAVPNYNNGGAEAVDVGCYEFDHGYGPRPATHTLTLTNVVVGSRVHIRDQADTVTHYDAIAAASSVVIPITVYGDSRDNWRIKVRKASAAPYYQPWETIMTATAGASSIYVSQIPD